MNETEAQLAGMLSAQRFLLEQIYANAFAGRPEDFQAMMEEALARPIHVSGPMDATVLAIQSAANRDHLERFTASTLQRIRHP